MKKIISIILIVLTIGAGIGGTTYFYIQNKNNIAQNLSLNQNLASVQASLNEIGPMVTVYEINTPVFSGEAIKETDLKSVSIPQSALGETSITDITQVLGKHYKIGYKPGTILTTDLLMDEGVTNEPEYNRVLQFESLPLDLAKGDFVDVRIMIPNGEEYIVFSHKEIMEMYPSVNSIVLGFTEDDEQIWNSVLAELGVYGNLLTVRVTKYLNPGLHTDKIAYWPVSSATVDALQHNPNIYDITRLVNVELRSHIDYILGIAQHESNESYAEGIANMFKGEFEATNTVRAEIEEAKKKAEEEGTLTYETGEETQDFNAAVGDASVSLEESLGAIAKEADPNVIR